MVKGCFTPNLLHKGVTGVPEVPEQPRGEGGMCRRRGGCTTTHSHMMLAFSVFTGGTVSRFGPSDSSHLWIRLNLSCCCYPYTILRLFGYLYSWTRRVAQGATAGEQTKVLWWKTHNVSKFFWAPFLSMPSQHLHCSPHDSLSKTMQ